MTIKLSLEHLWRTLQTHTQFQEGDEITMYVPKKVFEKLVWEFSQTQRMPEPSRPDTQELILFNTFKIRPEWELEYLERTIDNVRRAVR